MQKLSEYVQVAEAAVLATYRFEKYVGAAGSVSTKARPSSEFR